MPPHSEPTAPIKSPSPTLSQSHGRASPFLEHSLVNTKCTASPRSFVEPIKEHAEDTTMVAKTRSPVVSPTMRTSSPAPVYLNGARNAAIGSINPYLPKPVAGEERASLPALSGQQSMLSRHISMATKRRELVLPVHSPGGQRLPRCLRRSTIRRLICTHLREPTPTTQTKTKKSQVIKYLSERTDELALGLRYLRPDTLEGRRAEGKLVLVKLLQIMMDDGA